MKKDEMYIMKNHEVIYHDKVLLSEVSDCIFMEKDEKGFGVFLKAVAQQEDSRHVFDLGNINDLNRFVCSHRNSPFFMKAKAGTQISQIPLETQWLMVEHTDRQYTIFLPILDEPFRASLQGSHGGTLELVVETGDPAVVGNEVTALYMITGNNPYVLMEQAAVSAVHKMKTGNLRKDKKLPKVIDLLGWCTWDSFYHDVSFDKVREGLESFKEGGIIPKFLLLDDGWLSTTSVKEIGKRRLTDFRPNSKFDGRLKELIQMAKDEYGVKQFYVWHAICGYWGGVDQEAPAMMPYKIFMTVQKYSEGMNRVDAEYCKSLFFPFGFVPPESIHRFYHDYHRYLARQGVDGVKVDTQSVIEGLSYGFGGRVKVNRIYHEALEGSVQVHFKGGLINCMSCANDIIYQTLTSNIMRTSDDFFPNKPESHAVHIHTNAVVSFWAGEFIHPDWDMFQSGHPMGALHAAARAVSGGPVYVSDKPDSHNFDLLRKLVLSDGTVPRAKQIGKPTRDCLFVNPTTDPVIYKIFNKNETTGVVAAFNLHNISEEEHAAPVAGEIGAKDIEGLEGVAFAIYSHQTGQMAQCSGDETIPVSLMPLCFDIFTVAPIVNGMAPIGLIDKFNSGGTVVENHWMNETIYRVVLRDGGHFACWCEKEPSEVVVNGKVHHFTYDSSSHKLTVDIREQGTVVLEIKL